MGIIKDLRFIKVNGNNKRLIMSVEHKTNNKFDLYYKYVIAHIPTYYFIFF